MLIFFPNKKREGEKGRRGTGSQGFFFAFFALLIIRVRMYVCMYACIYVYIDRQIGKG